MPIFMSRDQMVERFAEIIHPHLEPGENLKEQIMVQSSASLGQMAATGPLSVAKRKIIYIGLSDRGYLIFVEYEFMGKLLSAHRVQLSQVENAKYRKGILQDSIRISISGSRPVKYQVAKWLCERSKALLGNIPRVA